MEGNFWAKRAAAAKASSGGANGSKDGSPAGNPSSGRGGDAKGAEGGVGPSSGNAGSGQQAKGQLTHARKQLEGLKVEDSRPVGVGSQAPTLEPVGVREDGDVRNPMVNVPEGENTEAIPGSSEPVQRPTTTEPAPVGTSGSLTVVQTINPRLTLLGEAEMDGSKKRPFRPRGPSTTQFKFPKPLSPSPMPITANHFPVKFHPKSFPQVVYHYDVVITPKAVGDSGDATADETTVPNRLLHVIWHKFEEKFHRQLGARIPFDGKKNCYTAKPLNLGNNDAWSDELIMRDPDDDDKTRTYKIQLKLANEVSTSSMFTYLRTCETWEYCELPQDVIQALDVALRYSPSLNYTPCNKSFYSSQGPHNLSYLLELWFGHNQSLLLGRDQRATLNVDMANKAFIKRLPIEEVMKTALKKDDRTMISTKWSKPQYQEAEALLKGKLVEYGTGSWINGKYEKRHRFTAVKVMNCTARTFSFPKNGRDITIQEYFQQEKGIKLKHPDWPVVHVGNKNGTNYVPIELCHIVPQAYKGKLEAQDTSEMIKGAAKPPADRFKRIETSRNNCNFEKCPILKEFGLEVGAEMIKIPTAFKLPKPEIQSRNERGTEECKAPRGNDGKFTIGKFLSGAEVPKIGVLNASGRMNRQFVEETIRKGFLEAVGQEALRLGMVSKDMGRGPVDRMFMNAEYEDARLIRGGNNAELFVTEVNEKLTHLKNKGCGLVFVIIGKDGNEYATVKNEAEVQVGILTQCIRTITVEKITGSQGRSQVMINLLLKVNAKLGGVNFQLGKTLIESFKFDREPVLILGADVTHPAPHSKAPSVAAITANYDLSGVCFKMHIQVQPATEEVISGIKDIVRMMLNEFRTRTNKVPRRIIMFRDGVSEGQFPAIKEKEFQGILDACTSLATSYQPKVTFLVVKKRHHTRFLPEREEDKVKPKDNIPPGTVVDTVITHPTEMEFFLNSHVGIQGTSKPTRYHVLHDDSNFSMQELEYLTYCLCYTFVRCTQPVSYPAPTYYAHLAAFRARALLEKEEDNADLNVLQERMTIHPDLINNYPMFFV